MAIRGHFAIRNSFINFDEPGECRGPVMSERADDE